MLAAELIAKKRDGARLSDAELTFLVTGITDAQSILQAWKGLCAMNGVDGSKTIVVGAPR